jgi:hypothetical protein
LMDTNLIGCTHLAADGARRLLVRPSQFVLAVVAPGARSCRRRVHWIMAITWWRW